MPALTVETEPLTLTTAQVHVLTRVLEACRCGTATEEQNLLIAEFFANFRAAVRAQGVDDRVSFFVHRARATRYWQMLEANEVNVR